MINIKGSIYKGMELNSLVNFFQIGPTLSFSDLKIIKANTINPSWKIKQSRDNNLIVLMFKQLHCKFQTYFIHVDLLSLKIKKKKKKDRKT